MKEATAFRGNLSNWNVAKVTDFSSMFLGAPLFDGDLRGWDVVEARKMGSMFQAAAAFNGDLSGWNVGKVTSMRAMFQEASLFNATLCGTAWVHSVADQDNMFTDAGAGAAIRESRTFCPCSGASRFLVLATCTESIL